MPVQTRYYESDMADRQWKIIKPLLPMAKSGPEKPGRLRSDLRMIGQVHLVTIILQAIDKPIPIVSRFNRNAAKAFTKRFES
jgi:transposase